MRETESYYSSLSEIKWFACHFLHRNAADTWKINSSDRQGKKAAWNVSVSEKRPDYETPRVMHTIPAVIPVL